MEATDEQRLSWWCQDCREVGMIHCSEVESCVETGDMAQIPYAEALEYHRQIRGL